MNKKSLWFVIVLFLGIISFKFDADISGKIHLIHNSVFDNIFLGLTFVSVEIIIFFFLTSLFLWSEHKRKWILPLWFSFFISAVFSFFLKIIVHRERPFQLGLTQIISVLDKASFATWNFSFPSFQTMLVFCAVPILSKNFRKFRYVWLVFAVLVGFSRIYFGVHFLSDVIFGGLIGYSIGILIVKFEEKNKFGEKILRRIFR